MPGSVPLEGVETPILLFVIAAEQVACRAANRTCRVAGRVSGLADDAVVLLTARQLVFGLVQLVAGAICCVVTGLGASLALIAFNYL